MNGLLWSEKWVVEKDEAWFISGEVDALFHVNFDSWKVEFVDQLPVIDVKNFKGHIASIKIGNRIYCLPNMGDNICIYNTEEKNWKIVPLSSSKNNRLKTIRSVENKGILYLLSDGLYEVIEIDLAQDSIINIISLNDSYKIKKQSENDEVSIAFLSSYISHNNVIIPMIDDLGLFVYSFPEKSLSIIDTKKFKYKPSTVYRFADNIIITGYDNRVLVCYDDKITELQLDDSVVRFQPKEAYYSDGRQIIFPFFHDIIEVNGMVWLIPYTTNCIIYMKDGKLNRFYIEEEDHTNADIMTGWKKNGRFSLLFIRGDRYIGLYSFSSWSILEIDTESFSYKYHNLCMDRYTSFRLDRLYDPIQIEEECGDLELLLKTI